jgi:hypothetical protein
VHAQRYLYLPYQLARLPLDLVGSKVMHRLPEGAPPRVLFERALDMVDRVAARVLEDEPSPPSPAQQPPAHDTTEDTADDVRAEARAAREESKKAKQHADARSNKNLKTIRQNVARTEAVVEAREHQAEAAGEDAPIR